MNSHRIALLAGLMIFALSLSNAEPRERKGAPRMSIQLSDEHIAAASRNRRIIINFDTISGDQRFGDRDPGELVKWKFHVIDAENVQIDSVWWGWGEGNQSPWPSKTMPLYDADGYRQWAEQGVDIAAVFAEASKERGIEAFYNYRINGSDNDLGAFRRIPMKLEHPDWLIPGVVFGEPGPVGYWNYAIPGVRQYKLSILREIAERFDYDGAAGQDDAVHAPVSGDDAGSGRKARPAVSGWSAHPGKPTGLSLRRLGYRNLGARKPGGRAGAGGTQL